MPFEDVYFGATRGHEGGYVWDPVDPGGETFRGITRRSHPGWTGWIMIDKCKTAGNKTAKAIDSYFKKDEEIARLVTALYKNQYWKPLEGTPAFPDPVQQKLFDTAVNTGQGPAVMILQRALARAGAPEVAADGKIGPVTRKAASGVDTKALLARMAECQAEYYRDLVRRKPALAKFLNGWLTRAAWLPK